MFGVEISFWFMIRQISIGKNSNEGDWIEFHIELYFIGFYLKFAKCENY